MAANSGSNVNSLLPTIVVALRSALILLALTSISFQDGASTDGPIVHPGEPGACRVSPVAPKETAALHSSRPFEGDERLAVDSVPRLPGTIAEVAVEPVGGPPLIAVFGPSKPDIVRRPLWLFGRSTRGPPSTRS